MTPFMKNHRPVIRAGTPIRDAAVASILALLMVERLRAEEESRRKANLEDWEDEGGSVGATGAAAAAARGGDDPGQEPSSIDTEAGAPGASSRVNAGSRVVAEVMTAASVTGRGSREAADDRSGGPACPRCNRPACRIQRRLVDRLISYFVPVRRYRCRSMGCGWEGNLREQHYFPAEPAPQ